MYPTSVMNLHIVLHGINCMLSASIKGLAIFLIHLFNCQLAHCFEFSLNFPKPKDIVILSERTTFITRSTKVFITPSMQRGYTFPFAQLQAVIKGIPKQKRFVERVEFLLVSSKSLTKYISGNALVSLLASDEGYLILSKNRKVNVISNTRWGLLRGCETLQSILVANHGEVQEMKIIDYPDLKTRALHFGFRNGDTFASARDLISKARLQHFNTIFVLIDGLTYYRSDKSHPENETYRDQVIQVVKFARKHSIDVIPEVKLLTKQKNWLFKDEYPELMLNRDTYNPDREEVYQIVFSILDEIIADIHPKAVHIGHDEVFGIVYDSKKQLNDKEVILSYYSFLYDVQKINAYLLSKNIKVMMWGDMLVSTSEYPDMDSLPLHGDVWRESRANIVPKNIIICDWHYFDDQAEFPTSQNFVNQGYQVMGATWGEIDKGRHKMNSMGTIKRFSRYMANIKKNNKGMIATTWYPISSQEKKDLIYQIIEASGEAFWNARLR